MSTSIHKVLGYGLVDIKTKNNKIVDPRINMVDGIMNSELYYSDAFKKETYSKWLKEKYDASPTTRDKLPYSWEREAVKESKRQLADCFIHQGEFGLQRVLCVMPIGCNDWYRRDCMIDYIEERKGSKPQRDRVTVYEDGFYPFIDYWDKRDGRHLDSGTACALRRALNARTNTQKKSGHIPWECSALTFTLGFDNAKQGVENTVPAVPEAIQLLCEFCKLLADPKAIWQFKPMLYTYWC
jgi:hypothetical protein